MKEMLEAGYTLTLKGEFEGLSRDKTPVLVLTDLDS